MLCTKRGSCICERYTWNLSKTNISSSPSCCRTTGVQDSIIIDIEFIKLNTSGEEKKIRKNFPIFIAAFKKSVFLQPIWMSNGVMAAQLTLDQLV